MLHDDIDIDLVIFFRKLAYEYHTISHPLCIYTMFHRLYMSLIICIPTNIFSVKMDSTKGSY